MHTKFRKHGGDLPRPVNHAGTILQYHKSKTQASVEYVQCQGGASGLFAKFDSFFSFLGFLYVSQFYIYKDTRFLAVYGGARPHGRRPLVACMMVGDLKFAAAIDRLSPPCRCVV